jgi:ABC-2 type transport system permease protein
MDAPSYDEQACNYDARAGLGIPVCRAVAGHISGLVGGGRLIERGCGTGEIGQHLVGESYTGFDRSAAMLREFRERCPGADLVVADGTVDWGSVVRGSVEFRLAVTLVTQQPQLDPEMTGRETLDLFVALYRTGAVPIPLLDSDLDKRVASYSGGMKRRLHLMIGSLAEPVLMGLDEPGAGLDEEGSALDLGSGPVRVGGDESARLASPPGLRPRCGAAMRIVAVLCLRSWRRVGRRPVTLTFSLAQPLFWMAFFGFLMQRFPLGDLPSNIRYLTFLVPGICGLTLMQGSSQSGIGLVRASQRGFLQRILATPSRRSDILAGILVAEVGRMHVQSGVIAVLGLALGARLVLAPGALLTALVATIAFAVAFSSLSCIIALRARAPEPMGTFVHLVNMPLLFTSTALVPSKQMPEWLAAISAFNPLTLVVDSLRRARVFGTAPSALNLGILEVLAVILGLVALRELHVMGLTPVESE